MESELELRNGGLITSAIKTEVQKIPLFNKWGLLLCSAAIPLLYWQKPAAYAKQVR